MKQSAFKAIRRDLNAVVRHDPAARNRFEAALCYSGFHALVMYRFFHFLYVHRYFMLARFLAFLTRFLTGIEIHPGAVIGSGVFIDHGAGVVIGETAVVGDNVVIYQGVTLGGTGKDKGKRHPTVESDVTLCSGAKVLGPFTIGKGAKIGAGAIVLGEVPPRATGVGIPAKIDRIAGKRFDCDENLINASPIEQPSNIDTIQNELTTLTARIERLETLLGEKTTENDGTAAETEQ
ncbi:MAG: serine O-acetyltransferase [Clostridiales bacterium]|nr:serine O-acetyltransferase [Clostridiales bacterium]